MPAIDAADADIVRRDTQALRSSFGGFATGVTIVTTRRDGAAIGATVNSFTSVSLDPPLLLVCFAHQARTLAAIRKAGIFAVNVLAHDQLALALRFAGPDRTWDGEPLSTLATGAPVLDRARASFDCRLVRTHDEGDHAVVIGAVTDHQADSARAPLLFHGGAYGAFAPDPG